MDCRCCGKQLSERAMKSHFMAKAARVYHVEFAYCIDCRVNNSESIRRRNSHRLHKDLIANFQRIGPPTNDLTAMEICEVQPMTEKYISEKFIVYVEDESE